MIKTCSKCGAINSEQAQTCCFCDTSLEPSDGVPSSPTEHTALEPGVAPPIVLEEEAPRAAAAAAAAGSVTPFPAQLPEPAAPPAGRSAPARPDWKREVAERVEAYRVRRDRLVAGENPDILSLFEPSSAPGIDPDAIQAVYERMHARERERERNTERVEIRVSQPELDFSPAEIEMIPDRENSEDPLLPVAEISERRVAGMLDAFFLLLSFGAFLGMFRALGGELQFAKKDAAVLGVALVLYYLQYFTLFTWFGGSTPGMLIRHLRVVSFDGTMPTPRQLLWRSFGYLVSGGTVLLGFLWALWDEDHLTWHDRISQTYLTADLPVGEVEENSLKS